MFVIYMYTDKVPLRGCWLTRDGPGIKDSPLTISQTSVEKTEPVPTVAPSAVAPAPVEDQKVLKDKENVARYWSVLH